MSPNQLGATLIGAAGIFIFGSRIPDLGMSLAFFVSDPDAYQGLGYGLLGFALAILSGGALVYWRQFLADKLFPATAQTNGPVGEGPESVGFALLGIYFTIRGLARLPSAELSPLSPPVIELILGIALFFGSRGLARLWATLRFAGRDPSTSGSENTPGVEHPGPRPQ